MQVVVLVRMGVIAFCVLWCGAAHAQTTYRTKSIPLVVPCSTGGSSDLITRLVANELTKMGRQVIVDNRLDAFGNSTADATKMVHDEIERWAAVIKAARIKLQRIS